MRGVRAARVRADARRLLRILKVDTELSIALVGDEEIRRLNARYRKKDRPTDVLAFPVDSAIRKRCGLLGDVVISLDGKGLLNDCPLTIEPCECIRPCGLHPLWKPARDAVIDFLRTTTIQAVAEARAEYTTA